MEKAEFFKECVTMHETRTSQLKDVLYLLETQKILSFEDLNGEFVIDIGCGTAPCETILKDNFKRYLGIDTNPSMIEFCKGNVESKKSRFEKTNAYSMIDSLGYDSIDLALMLDIDSNIQILDLLTALATKMKKDKVILITERGANQEIYNRLFIKAYLPLLPSLEKLYCFRYLDTGRDFDRHILIARRI